MRALRFLFIAAVVSLLAAPSRAADYSSSPTTVAALTGASNVVLTTAPAYTGRGQWFCMNQSAARIWIVLDDGQSTATDGSDPSRTIFILDAGAGANMQGGSMGWQDVGGWQGRIRVYGPAGSQVALIRN